MYITYVSMCVFGLSLEYVQTEQQFLRFNLE